MKALFSCLNLAFLGLLINGQSIKPIFQNGETESNVWNYPARSEISPSPYLGYQLDTTQKPEQTNSFQPGLSLGQQNVPRLNAIKFVNRIQNVPLEYTSNQAKTFEDLFSNNNGHQVNANRHFINPHKNTFHNSDSVMHNRQIELLKQAQISGTTVNADPKSVINQKSINNFHNIRPTVSSTHVSHLRMPSFGLRTQDILAATHPKHRNQVLQRLLQSQNPAPNSPLNYQRQEQQLSHKATQNKSKDLIDVKLNIQQNHLTNQQKNLKLQQLQLLKDYQEIQIKLRKLEEQQNKFLGSYDVEAELKLSGKSAEQTSARQQNKPMLEHLNPVTHFDKQKIFQVNTKDKNDQLSRVTTESFQQSNSEIFESSFTDRPISYKDQNFPSQVRSESDINVKDNNIRNNQQILLKKIIQQIKPPKLNDKARNFGRSRIINPDFVKKIVNPTQLNISTGLLKRLKFKPETSIDSTNIAKEISASKTLMFHRNTSSAESDSMVPGNTAHTLTQFSLNQKQSSTPTEKKIIQDEFTDFFGPFENVQLRSIKLPAKELKTPITIPLQRKIQESVTNVSNRYGPFEIIDLIN